MATLKLELMEFRYLGFMMLKREINPEIYEKACAGNHKMREVIAEAYFRNLGLKRAPANWEWRLFTIRRTGLQSSKRAPYKSIDTYDCTCQMSTGKCTPCRKGWHKSCRYDCEYGMPVMHGNNVFMLPIAPEVR